jgi:UDP-N-acetylglucosamine--N-acetylmuramyl-(pentapeptide) pyrophosphoryl-undecaprenol N-acetylglucosamine transferase
MATTPHIVFAGGGTTGHLYPGIAVATRLKEQYPGVQITFAGTGNAWERHTVRNEGFQYATIPAQPAPQNPLEALRFVTDSVAGFWASRWIFKENEISLVVGLGGFASAMVVRAAAARKIPTVLLEPNAIPAGITRSFATSVDLVCAGFEQVQSHLSAQTALNVTGNPVRVAFDRLYSDHQTKNNGPARHHAEKRLVVMGGSHGARSFNEFVPVALRQLGNHLDGWRIIHQTGEGQLQETERRYKKCGVEALVVSFIDEIASVLFETDLVVCRAGGVTLSELALAGVPAVVVPFPHSVDGHQMANAKAFADGGACRIIDETTVPLDQLDEVLAHELRKLITSDERRAEMAANMRRLARPKAAAQIATSICDILNGKPAQVAA